MLTSFFGKSNPANYLLLGVFIVLGDLLGALSGSTILFTPFLVWKYGFFMLLSVFSMFLLDFIIRKNSLTKSNTYAILFFSCFMVMVPNIFLQPNILLANAFLLLSLRRILSLRTDKNSEKKILDASVWITVASFFYFWSFLFFVPLWVAIAQKPNTSYKQMLIPLTGFFAACIINTAFQLVIANSFNWIFEWKEPISFDFSKYNSINLLLPVAVIIAFIIWTGINRISKFSTLSSKERPNYFLLLYVIITSIFVSLASPQKTGAEILFVLGPLAIISANYIENFAPTRTGKKDIGEFWFKEILLWLVVLLPIFLLFL